jgi:signal transduction histidine kinase
MVTLPSLTPEILVPRLGESLIEEGMLTREELDKALVAQQNARSKGQSILLGQVLVDLGFVQRSQLDRVITEQILNLRNALQHANEDLEKRVQERTAELEIAYKKLAELNQLKSNFIANISHEFRTPMTHIKGYLELFVRHDLGDLSEDQYSAIEVMVKSSNRLEKLINDLILFTMMERGSVTLDLKPVSLLVILQLAFTDIQEKASLKEHKMEQWFDTKDATVVVDQQKFLWVLDELLENAIKFTPSKGIIKFKYRHQGDSVLISISDSGIGIPADKIGEVFEPFHQLDGSSTRRYGGTGLGLSLARAILKAHGSDIQIASTEKKGTEISFVLKIKDQASE